MSRDAIAELERWKSKHKARWCAISIDDGYGACCWEVVLQGEEGGKVIAAEAQFMGGQPPPNGVIAPGGDWPGLAATILAALDHWEAGHRWPKPKDVVGG